MNKDRTAHFFPDKQGITARWSGEVVSLTGRAWINNKDARLLYQINTSKGSRLIDSRSLHFYKEAA